MSSNTNQTSSFQRVIEGMYDFLIANNLVTVLPEIQNSDSLTARQQNKALNPTSDIASWIRENNFDSLIKSQQIEDSIKGELNNLYDIAKELSESQDSLQKEKLEMYLHMMDSEGYKNISTLYNSANTELNSFAKKNGIESLQNNTNARQVDAISLFSKIKNDKEEFKGLLKSLQDLKKTYIESDLIQKQQKNVAKVNVAKVLEEILLNKDPEQIDSLRTKLDNVKQENPQWADGRFTKKLLEKNNEIVDFINDAIKEYNNIRQPDPDEFKLPPIYKSTLISFQGK